MTDDHDFDFEPLPGLPAPLPAGERMVWRGSPDPWRLAVRACRLPLVGAYFIALAGWQLFGAMRSGASLAEITSTLSFTATLAALSLALLAALGWALGKNAIYTVTTRRVIIRHGVAMPMAINVPFAKVDGAEHRAYASGTGDISLSLSPGSRVPYLLLWPHARPGRYWPSQPMLRAVPDSARVARLVSDALAAANAEEVARAATAAGPPEAITSKPAAPIRNQPSIKPHGEGMIVASTVTAS